MIDVLRKVPLFAELTTKELKLVLGVAREHKFAPGEPIVEQGGIDKRLHIIVEGMAKVVANGRTRRRLGPGDYFGEIAMFDGGPRTASIVAESEVRTLSLASFTLFPLLREHPNILLKLTAGLCARLREAERALTA
jgi:CRP/FNR family transcriptional regulator